MNIFSLKLFFFIFVFFKKKKNIFSLVGFTLIIINPKIIPREFLATTNLFYAQILCIYKMRNIVIVNREKNLILAVFKIVTSSFESFNHCKKINIINFVLSVSQYHLYRKRRYKMLLVQLKPSQIFKLSLIWLRISSYLINNHTIKNKTIKNQTIKNQTIKN